MCQFSWITRMRYSSCTCTWHQNANVPSDTSTCIAKCACSPRTTGYCEWSVRHWSCSMHHLWHPTRSIQTWHHSLQITRNTLHSHCDACSLGWLHNCWSILDASPVSPFSFSRCGHSFRSHAPPSLLTWRKKFMSLFFLLITFILLLTSMLNTDF